MKWQSKRLRSEQVNEYKYTYCMAYTFEIYTLCVAVMVVVAAAASVLHYTSESEQHNILSHRVPVILTHTHTPRVLARTLWLYSMHVKNFY